MNAARRKAIYAALVALGGVAVAFGLVTQQQNEAIAGILLALSNALAFLNVNEDVE